MTRILPAVHDSGDSRRSRRRFLRDALALTAAAATAAIGPRIAQARPGASRSSGTLRESPPARLIDFRARPNTAEYMRMFPPETWTQTSPALEPVSLPEFIRQLDVAGVSKAVFTGRQSAQANMWLSNDYVAECVGAFPERLVGLAGADPRGNREAVREADRALRSLGLRGLSIDLFEMYPDDRRLYPLYHKCLDFDVPVVLTMGPRLGPYASPASLFTVVADLPDLKVVCSHAIYPRVDEFIALAHFSRHVYIEASIYHYLPGAEAILEAANTILQDRVLYGSGFPFAPLTDYRRLLRHTFDPGVLDKLLHLNAARLLKLDAPEP